MDTLRGGWASLQRSWQTGELQHAVRSAAESAATKAKEIGSKTSTQLRESWHEIQRAARTAEDFGLVFVTPRVVAAGDLSRPDYLAAQAADFLCKHGQRALLVINLSERTCNFSQSSSGGSDNNVPTDEAADVNDVVYTEHFFSGLPVPPLKRLLILCAQMHEWLNSNPSNIVLVHCANGRGRTFAVLSALLAWRSLSNSLPVDEPKFESPRQVLVAAASKLQLSLSQLVLPSQARYLHYVARMTSDAQRMPAYGAVAVKRIVMHTVPRITKLPSGDVGACVYAQLFKETTLLATSPTYTVVQDGEGPLVIEFEEAAVLHGDALLRVRHVQQDRRVTLLRIAFHSGYLVAGDSEEGATRFKRSQCDGAWNDRRFDAHFALDVYARRLSEEDTREYGVHETAQEWSQLWQSLAHPDRVDDRQHSDQTDETEANQQINATESESAAAAVVNNETDENETDQTTQKTDASVDTADEPAIVPGRTQESTQDQGSVSWEQVPEKSERARADETDRTDAGDADDNTAALLAEIDAELGAAGTLHNALLARTVSCVLPDEDDENDEDIDLDGLMAQLQDSGIDI
ncbi:MAG: hypothetical protein MHM6MM_007155 [Cercozoa sp. M6MM]